MHVYLVHSQYKNQWFTQPQDCASAGPLPPDTSHVPIHIYAPGPSYCYSISPRVGQGLPILMSARPHVLHRRKAALYPGMPVQALYYGFAHMEVVGVPSSL